MEDADIRPARLLRSALPAELFDRVQASADDLAASPNFWVPREVVERGRSHGCSAAEEAVAALYPLVKPDLPDSWAGAEYWVQVYEGGRGLGFHFDKDEHEMKERGVVVTPIVSSVLYLTGAKCAPLQAPTVILDQRHHPSLRPSPENPTASSLVFPRRNHYCIFDGALGHGVLDSGCAERRATLLVNWWAKKPAAVERCAAEAAAAAPEAGAEPATAEEICFKAVSVRESDAQDEDVLMVDDLLERHGLALKGVMAVQAVTISHPGLALYPIDDEQLRAAQGEILVGAAFLPLTSDAECTSSDSSQSVQFSKNEPGFAAFGPVPGGPLLQEMEAAFFNSGSKRQAGGAPPSLASLPDELLARVLGLDSLHNCLASVQVNTRLRRVALDVLRLRAADPATLCTAASAGSVAIVRAVLGAEGAGVNMARPNDGFTPLYLAARMGHIEIVRLLLGGGANVDKAFTQTGDTPVCEAARQGHASIVRLLLGAGADVNKATTDNGATPLSIAAQQGRAEIVQVLLGGGAIVDKARTEDGVTPLFLAAQQGSVELVQLLLGAGADMDKATTNRGATPLSIAARKGHAEVVRMLLGGGADVDKARTDCGATPLLMAAESGHAEVVRMLLGGGADVDKATTERGATPLLMAAQNGHAEVARMLLGVGADVDKARTDRGATPLFMAAQEGHAQLVLLLLGYGACVDKATTDNFCTPLSVAAQEGHAIVVQLLAAAAQI